MSDPTQAAEDVLGDHKELVERLRGRVWNQHYADHEPVECVDVDAVRAADVIEHLSAELARKTAVSDAYWEIVESFKKENDELRAALKPFAEYHGSDEYLKSAPDDGLCAAASFTAGDYRKARAILAQHAPKGG